jgi:prepilin peptidase CpaA
MNLAPHAPLWLLALLGAAIVAAAVEDFIRLRISNITCGVVLVTALVAMGLQGFSLDLWQNGVVFLAFLLAGTALFAAGQMGGGDVKLMAALGLWVNIASGIWLLATTLVAGGAIALIYLATRAVRKDRSSRQIPYGLAIGVGACIVLAGQLGWLHAKPDRPAALTVRPLG